MKKIFLKWFNKKNLANLILYAVVIVMISLGILVLIGTMYLIAFKFIELSFLPFSTLFEIKLLASDFFVFILKQPYIIAIVVLLAIPLSYVALE